MNPYQTPAYCNEPISWFDPEWWLFLLLKVCIVIVALPFVIVFWIIAIVVMFLFVYCLALAVPFRMLLGYRADTEDKGASITCYLLTIVLLCYWYCWLAYRIDLIDILIVDPVHEFIKHSRIP